MMIDEIKKLIQVGEKTDVEFKESKIALTKDVFDTVCSFNNRNGGHILLGVNDKREIVGVSEDKVDKVIKEFTTAINNPQKMYPPLYLLPEVFDIDEKKVIYIKVPDGYQACRHNGRIWDRSYEGDINITDHSEFVYKLYARKKGSYFVNKVYVFETPWDNLKETLKELTSFIVSRIGTGLLCDILIFALMINILMINDVISKITTQILVVILNYVIGKFIVFKEKNN